MVVPETGSDVHAAERIKAMSVRPSPLKNALPPGKEPERVRVDLDLNVLEPRGSQTIGKSVRIDEHHRVEEMQNPERTAVDAVDTDEHATCS
jgi:hypothetical protein